MIGDTYTTAKIPRLDKNNTQFNGRKKISFHTAVFKARYHFSAQFGLYGSLNQKFNATIKKVLIIHSARISRKKSLYKFL